VSLGETLLFGIDHDHELAAPGHQFSQPDGQIIRQWPYCRPHRLGEVGNHGRLDRRRLGIAQLHGCEFGHAQIPSLPRQACYPAYSQNH
jgi:hypothetical protein